MTRWKAGDGARVVDLSDLKLPKGKPPFAVGDIVEVSAVSADGKSLRFPKHSGWFRANRFEKL